MESNQPRRSISHAKFTISELGVLFGTFALLVAGAVLSLLLQVGVPDGPPLSARAYGVTGSVTLARWTEALGYEVHMVEGRPYRLPEEMRLLFVLQPNELYALAGAEQDALMSWVRAGGTLVLAVQEYVSYPLTRRGSAQVASGDAAVLGAFDFALSDGLSNQVSDLVTATLQQPLLTQPVVGPFRLLLPDALDAPADAVTLAAIDGKTILASRRVGNGRVIASSTTYPFTNEGLRDDGNARLVLNLLHLAPQGSLVGFDEYHHGSRQSPSIAAWLFSASAGQAVLLALILLAAYILWTGRRFGRVFVSPELRIRRQPSEFVLAMANLARAAGQHRATLLHYRDGLKRRLGRPYRIDPNLDDEAFVAELRAVDPGLDHRRLAQLLRDLAAPGSRVSTAQFVRLAREAGEFG
ncbi:MAG: DUF4350 domain-containing protein [Chloroflexi bacterium]|nr:DUF4350 domain-containing protein [Chloroflexota bacterium]